MRTVLSFAVMAICCWATGGVALTPLPVCEGDAIGTSNEIGDYSPSPLGQGFVWYTAVERATDAWMSVLEYCPQQRQLVVRQGIAGDDATINDAAALRFQDMVFGSESFTMDEMAAQLRGMGANVEIRRAGYASCACGTI